MVLINNSESTPRVYGKTRYGTSSYGHRPSGYVGHDNPWHLSGVRVDGLSAAGPLSPVRPGTERTLTCVFAPQPARGDPADDHTARYHDAREYLVNASDVVVFDPPGQQVFYREQHDGASQLVRIEPLATASDGTPVNGSVPGRESVHRGRWAVVTGGEPAAGRSRPDRALALELTVVDLALSEAPPTGQTRAAPVYETRRAAVAALERNAL
jgi:hypothetical protein